MRTEDVQQLSEKALASTMRGNWADSVEKYNQVVQMTPRSANVWFMLGRASAELDRLDDTATAYRKALHIKPDIAEALLAGGICCLDRDNGRRQ